MNSITSKKEWWRLNYIYMLPDRRFPRSYSLIHPFLSYVGYVGTNPCTYLNNIPNHSTAAVSTPHRSRIKPGPRHTAPSSCIYTISHLHENNFDSSAIIIVPHRFCCLQAEQQWPRIPHLFDVPHLISAVFLRPHLFNRTSLPHPEAVANQCTIRKPGG